jgi:hypothetical protein
LPNGWFDGLGTGIAFLPAAAMPVCHNGNLASFTRRIVRAGPQFNPRFMSAGFSLQVKPYSFYHFTPPGHVGWAVRL